MVGDVAHFLTLSDDMAGESLGFMPGTRKAASRGRRAKEIAQALSSQPGGTRHPLHNVRSGTEKEVLDGILGAFPALLTKSEGYLPRSSAMMRIVEHRLGGQITSANLAAANEVCSNIVDEVVGPRLRKFMRDTIHPDGPYVPPSEDELVKFLTGPYAQYAKAEANSLVSRAGNLNEALVREAIRAAGLLDAIQTGTEGNADIQIITKGLTPPQTLSVEVKSYGARERLLRGLQDCNTPKVGVGFFNKASEFNGERTSQLLATNASAIYLPEATLNGLDVATRSRQNSHGGIFYRGLADFGPEMSLFAQVGSRVFSPKT